jgi:hypothetical protein
VGAFYAIVLLIRSAGKSSSNSPREIFLRGEFPFGVFLGAMSLVAVFFGEAAWRWYLQFF